MKKNNFQLLHVTPVKLKKPVFVAVLIGAILCTLAVPLCLWGMNRWPALGYVSILLGLVCLAIWLPFVYYGIYLPRGSICLDLTRKEFTLVTPRKTVKAALNEVSYTVTAFGIRQPTYFLHLFYQGEKMIRLRTGDWNNIKFLLDLPHKPDPKIGKLKKII